MTHRYHSVFKHNFLTLVEKTHRSVRMLAALLEKLPHFSEASRPLTEEHTIHQALEEATLSLAQMLSHPIALEKVSFLPQRNNATRTQRVDGLDCPGHPVR